jgi:hypothetical protein
MYNTILEKQANAPLGEHKDSIAKQCALIAVDEILNINSVDKDFSLSHYWLDVKDEIVNLKNKNNV